MEQLFPVTSLTNIAAISLERMNATFFPFKHRVISKRIFGLIVTAVWVTALLLSGIYYPHGGTIVLDFYQYSWSLFNLVCQLAFFVSYVSIVVKSYCGALRHEHHCSASRERKLTITLLIMTLVSLLLYFPLAVLVSVISSAATENGSYGYGSLSILNFKRLNFTLMILCYTNSLVNPILYTFRMPEFKRALASLFLCRSQREQAVFPLRAV